MKYEIRVSHNLFWTPKRPRFDVDLIVWERGEGVAFGRGFNVSRKQAQETTTEQARIYAAEITGMP